MHFCEGFKSWNVEVGRKSFPFHRRTCLTLKTISYHKLRLNISASKCHRKRLNNVEEKGTWKESHSISQNCLIISKWLIFILHWDCKAMKTFSQLLSEVIKLCLCDNLFILLQICFYISHASQVLPWPFVFSLCHWFSLTVSVLPFVSASIFNYEYNQRCCFSLLHFEIFSSTVGGNDK